jgi:hypothetical protein
MEVPVARPLRQRRSRDGPPRANEVPDGELRAQELQTPPRGRPPISGSRRRRLGQVEFRDSRRGRRHRRDPTWALAGRRGDRILEQPSVPLLQHRRCPQWALAADDAPDRCLMREHRTIRGIGAVAREEARAGHAGEQVAPGRFFPLIRDHGAPRRERRRQRVRQPRVVQVRSLSAGNRMTSRIVSRPVSTIVSRSMPTPSPPVGGIPYASAST